MQKLSEHDLAVLNCVFNPNLPLEQAYEEHPTSEPLDAEEDTSAVITSKELELRSVECANKTEYAEALRLLNRAVEIAPFRPSPYNNRAQVYQLLGNVEAARENLSKAIELGRDKYPKTTRQALCQRGLLFRKEERDELARDDFNDAAKLGSAFAKTQLIEMNPYAALCNQMLRQAFENLQ